MASRNFESSRSRISPARIALALVLIALGLAFAAGGFYVGETDDAPGAALLGLLLMTGLITCAVRILRRKPRPDRINSEQSD